MTASAYWKITKIIVALFIVISTVNLQYAPNYQSGTNATSDGLNVFRYTGDNPTYITGTIPGTIPNNISSNSSKDSSNNYYPYRYGEGEEIATEQPSNIYYSNPDDVQSGRQETFTLGVCSIVINRQCPHPDVRYFLFSQDHPEDPEEIRVGADPLVSNLSLSSFDPTIPTKIIIHGFNSDMLLNGLIEIKNQYLIRDKYNVFTIDWGAISQGPCYPAAVWNARFAGRCGAILIQRLKELGNHDIHVIGFSLGAHVASFIANNLRPYLLPRITGLDAALPLFTTPNINDKLDKTDAVFVDVLHTNAFFQGKVEECGHVDFYLNGGSIQPGCWADPRYLACNHHRAAFYFAESINSGAGFWGWYCSSYIMYLLGRCPPSEPQIVMGEDVNRASSRGMHLVLTDSVSPFAVGRFEGPTIDILIQRSEQIRRDDFERFKNEISPDCKEGDDNGGDNEDSLDYIGQNVNPGGTISMDLNPEWFDDRLFGEDPSLDGLDFSPIFPEFGFVDGDLSAFFYDGFGPLPLPIEEDIPPPPILDDIPPPPLPPHPSLLFHEEFDDFF